MLKYYLRSSLTACNLGTELMSIIQTDKQKETATCKQCRKNEERLRRDIKATTCVNMEEDLGSDYCVWMCTCIHLL